ncbi:hypothetical protein [Leuconostoc mesenteroides]|uniref:hypothetical protein n=1 Tax=Leuconostoc mesenteroides TaxID=1245 RepID=UPI00235E3933|nr:hypothetical protein [Leuconostoc mesenteroides]
MKNKKVMSVLMDFWAVGSSNLLSLLISIIIVLVVPKLIGVLDYGYWQIFTFYAGYVGILHFGLLDGIYLRYGGIYYSDLDKGKMYSQFCILMCFEFLFASILFVSGLIIKKPNFSFIMVSLSIYLLIYMSQSFLKYILQMTNRMRYYSAVMITSNLVYIIILVITLLLGFRDYKFLVSAYIIGNAFGVFLASYILRDLFIEGIRNFSWDWKELFTNISVGSQIIAANIISTMIIGIIRIGVQKGWGVATFGKVSLTLSISNLLMIFINAISLVLFPKLKRLEKSSLNIMYTSIRDLLMPIVFVGMLLYYPMSYVIPIWLPKYDSALIYMSLLFPIVIYQSKFEVISNTFLKVLRMEKIILFINLSILILSLLLAFVSVVVFHNLDITVLSIILVMAMRSTIAEIAISSRLKVNLLKELLIEFIMVVSFIMLAWYVKNIFSIVLYLMILGIYLSVKKNDIRQAIKNIKSI